MTALSPVGRVLSHAIQTMIQYDPAALKRLKPMAGKVVKINIEPINQSLVLILHSERIEVSTDSDITADTTISGKPSALFAMGTNQHIPGLEGVTINGDATTGQFVADFIKQLQPDWEDAWCDLLGEGPGYQVSEFLKSMKNVGSQLFKSVRASSHDYLLEERRELIASHEMEDFLDQVDDLQADWVRLERKWQQLEQSGKFPQT